MDCDYHQQHSSRTLKLSDDDDGELMNEYCDNKPSKNMLSGTAKIATGVAMVAGLLLAWRIYHDRHHRWKAPFMWKTCTEVFEEYPEDLWYATLDSVGSPCSSESKDPALCTYSRERLHMYCEGRYYQTTSTISRDSETVDWTFEERGTKGALDSVWEDSKNCDELELEGWYLVCNNADDDVQNLSCARNSLYGYVVCGNSGINYHYVGDGRYRRVGSGSKGDWVIVDTETGTASFTYASDDGS